MAKSYVSPTPTALEPGDIISDPPMTSSHGEGAWDGLAVRAARERAGITLEDMASRTKINTSILRALEDERFEDAPKARVYVRGFIRCMADEIGLDADAVARSYVPRWERWFERAETTLSY